MNFRSDNASPAAPEIMQAVIDANLPSTHGYGGDEYCARAADQLRECLNAPKAKVYFVATGTAANALALSVLVKPWESVFCHDHAHIEVDEAGAPEFFTNGAKLYHVDADLGVIKPDALDALIAQTGALGVHNWQRGAISLTNLTEQGALYQKDDLRQISSIAQKYALPIHLDGARFANAVAASGESAANMSHGSGVDVLVFGGTKNGLIAGEAVVIFDEKYAWDFEMRRKRGGHLLSKGQYFGAQFSAYLDNENWLHWARHANAQMQVLYEALKDKADVKFEQKPVGNMAYLSFPRAFHKALIAAGALYYLEPATQSLDGADDEALRCRLVTSWCTSDDEVQSFAKYF